MNVLKKILLTAVIGVAAVSYAVSATTTPQAKPEHVRFYALDCGHIQFDDFGSFSDTGAYDHQSRELSDVCVLVGHPKGWLLWDTGLSKSIQGKPLKAFGATMTVQKTIQEQLAEIGLTTDDIHYVAFSHFHFDHTGNANDFKNATWILQEKELNYGLSTPTPAGIEPSVFTGYKEAKKLMINGDHDVFGDGSVRFFAVPGHTPGHQALLVKLPKQNYIFSGDLYHQEESRAHQYVPVFNQNRADTLASMNRLEGLVKANKAKLIVQHDKTDFESLPKFPQYSQ